MKNVDNKKIIGFDLDGVIINHMPAKIKLAKEFGFNLKPKQTPSEIIEFIIKRPVLDQFLQTLYYDSRFFKTAFLMRGVKSGLSKLQENDLPFVLISRRHEPKATIIALKYHGLWPKFFNENNTFFVAKPEDKNVKAREIGVTHYVDDEASVLEKLVDVKNRFLFDNLGAFKNNNGYTRVESWKKLIKHFLI